MDVGMFTMSEIEELFVLQDENEINGCTYLIYAHWNHDFIDCRKLLVNITDKWYVYPQGGTHQYIHYAFISCPSHTDTHRHRRPLSANDGQNNSAIYTTIKGNISNNCAYCTMKISYFGTLWTCVRVCETYTWLMFSNICSLYNNCGKCYSELSCKGSICTNIDRVLSYL